MTSKERRKARRKHYAKAAPGSIERDILLGIYLNSRPQQDRCEFVSPAQYEILRDLGVTVPK